MDTEKSTIQNETSSEVENESPLYEANYVLTEEVYKKLILRARPWLRLLISWALLVAACFLLSLANKNRTDTLWPSLIIVTIVMPLTIFIALRRNLKNFRQDKSLYNSERHLKFYSDRLVIETPRGNRITPYSELYKIKEKKDYFYLYISKNRFIPVIKEYCSEELMDFIRKIK